MPTPHATIARGMGTGRRVGRLTSGRAVERLATLAAIRLRLRHRLRYNVADSALIGIFSSVSNSMSDSAGRPSVVR